MSQFAPYLLGVGVAVLGDSLWRELNASREACKEKVRRRQTDAVIGIPLGR